MMFTMLKNKKKEEERNLRMFRDRDFRHFLSGFCENNPACFWQLATNSRELSSVCICICMDTL